MSQAKKARVETNDSISKMLKPELISSAKKNNLNSSGTVAELKKLLIAHILKKADDEEESEEDDDVGEEISDLKGLSLKALRLMAAKANLTDTGTKQELIEILSSAFKSKSTAATSPIGNVVIAPTVVIAPPVDDGWKTTLKLYLTVDLSPMILSWESPATMLTPGVWPIIFWRQVLPRSEIYGLLGTDGPMLRALSERWKTILGCGEADMVQIRAYWTTMFELVSSRAPISPDEWCRRFFETNVRPVVRLFHRLQGEKHLASGQSAAGHLLIQMAQIPSEFVGADVKDMVEKSNLKSLNIPRIEDRSGGNENGRPRSNNNNNNNKNPKRSFDRNIKCKNCRMSAYVADHQAKIKWFETHNKVCKH